MGPHAALRIGALLVDGDMEAARAALRYAADHGYGRVAEVARQNIEALARRGISPRAVPQPWKRSSDAAQWESAAGGSRRAISRASALRTARLMGST